MAKKHPPASGLGLIAKAAGVTRAAVSYALRNKPGVSPATRKRILGIAQKMGYVPDARIASWMATVRESKAKELIPLAWLNHHTLDKNAWRKFPYLTPYLEGAKKRAGELGYRLEEIWAGDPSLSMQRLSKILYHRGIEGVILTEYVRHFHLKWEFFASIALESALIAPRLSRVMSDLIYNLFLAAKMLKRLGYTRSGICLEEGMKFSGNFTLVPAAAYLSSITPSRNRIPPLFYSWTTSKEGNETKTREQVEAWIKRWKPDVVVCHNSQMLEWCRDFGLKVPRDIGIVHLATDDDVSDWAGIHSNRRIIGKTVVEQVIAKVQTRSFGLPKEAADLLIRGSWHTGKTLLSLKTGS